jgi:hypothetical protein
VAIGCGGRAEPAADQPAIVALASSVENRRFDREFWVETGWCDPALFGRARRTCRLQRLSATPNCRNVVAAARALEVPGLGASISSRCDRKDPR